ncbi:MAG: hypothetical protein R3C11_08220 [Planctomycetaceae bacterium]
MRLTLRTLLAYLDDVLDATNTREIGKKIQESQYATNLVARIKKVTRQRRLMAPDLDPNESHLDANMVAEYLDNTLTPDEINQVEKVCLDSDVQLAEVAAAHQVLTLILGEPVDIPSDTRNRMYKIVPHAPARKERLSSSELEGEEQPFMEVTKSSSEFRLPPLPTSSKSATEEHEPSFKEELPEYLRNNSTSRSRIPLIVACVTLAIFISLLVIDPTLRNLIFPSDQSEPKDQLITSNEPAEEELLGDEGKIDEPLIEEETTTTLTDETSAGETETPASTDTPPAENTEETRDGVCCRRFKQEI